MVELDANDDRNRWVDRKVKEVEEILSLAEEVSKNIRILEDKIDGLSMRTSIALLVAGLAWVGAALFSLDASMNSSDLSSTLAQGGFALTSLALIPVMVLFVSSRRHVSRLKAEKAVEERIVQELVGKIDTLTRALDSEVPVVKKALFSMRLSRIRFSP